MKKFESRVVLGKEFGIYGTVEEPLFLAKDVAEWIGHSNPSKMIKDAELEEYETVKAVLSSLTSSYRALFITEDGLYEVLFQSRKPIAKQCKKEVKTILKEIRQNGVYISETATEEQKSYNYNMLDVTFKKIGAEFFRAEYEVCISFHEKNKTRLNYERSSKDRRSDKKRTFPESKIKIMEKILKIAEGREQQYRVNFQWELKSLISEVVKVVKLDIKTIKHNQTRGKLSQANKIS
jgi:prophage antirepressor-like protein